MNYKHFILLSLIICLLSIFRWNRQDVFISKFVGKENSTLGSNLEYNVGMNDDTYSYVQYVNYYKGKDVAAEVSKPFTYRFLIPLISSVLPFDAFSSLNVINLLSEILFLFILMKVLLILKFDQKTIFLTSLLHAFSFPVFYYGVIGHIDAPSVLLFILGIYLAFKNNYWGMVLLMILGTFVNEKIVIILPFYFIYKWIGKDFKTSFWQTALLGILFLTCIYLVRNYTINSDTQYFWKADSDLFFKNLSRIKTYLSLMLTGGLPLLIFILSVKHINFRTAHNAALATGVFFVILLILYSILSAYTDGRFMWYIYPFILPLCAIGIGKWINKKKQMLNN